MQAIVPSRCGLHSVVRRSRLCLDVSDDLQSATVVDIGESYSSQNLVEWRGSFWFMGTRLRGTVPLGLVLSREVEGVPTLTEIH